MRARGEALPEKRKRGGNWARARKAGLLELVERGTAWSAHARTVAK